VKENAINVSKNIVNYSTLLFNKKNKITEYKELCENIKNIFTMENVVCLNFKELFNKIINSSRELNMYEIGK